MRMQSQPYLSLLRLHRGRFPFDEAYFLLPAFEPFHQTAFTLRVSETILGPSRLGLSETAAAPARVRYHARRVCEESRTRVPLPLCESFSFGAPPLTYFI